MTKRAFDPLPIYTPIAHYAATNAAPQIGNQDVRVRTGTNEGIAVTHVCRQLTKVTELLNNSIPIICHRSYLTTARFSPTAFSRCPILTVPIPTLPTPLLRKLFNMFRYGHEQPGNLKTQIPLCGERETLMMIP